MRLTLFLAASLLACGPATAQAYSEYVGRLAAGDTEIDYLAFRLAYAESDAYDPYSAEARDRSHRLLEFFFDAADLSSAQSVVDSALAINYTDIDAHIVASMMADEQQDSTRALYHRAIANGRDEAILEQAEGTTPKAPLRVISVDEELTILIVLGLDVSGRTMVDCNSSRCDRIWVRNLETGETHALYFDVSIPLNSLRRQGHE